jgi:putative FmdB family regulatory protein
MAIYEYRCRVCSLVESVSRGMHDEEVIPECSTCKVNLNRVYSSVGVTFNGGGFYSTDKGK